MLAVLFDALRAPHQLAVARPHTDAGLRGQRHDRANALDIGHDAGRIAGGIAQIARGPDGLAGEFVERGDARLAAARRDDEVVAIDQRRLADEPLRIGAAEVLEDVPRPDDRTVAGLQAREIAVLRQAHRGDRRRRLACPAGRRPCPGRAPDRASWSRARRHRRASGRRPRCSCPECPARRCGRRRSRRCRSRVPGQRWTRPARGRPSATS